MSRPTRTKSRYSFDKNGKIVAADAKDEEPEDVSRISNGPNIYVRMKLPM
jgi:hypothetical protein